MAVSPFAENQRVTRETVKPSRRISKSTKSGIRPLLQERIIDLISRTGAFGPANQLSCPCDSKERKKRRSCGASPLGCILEGSLLKIPRGAVLKDELVFFGIVIVERLKERIILRVGDDGLDKLLRIFVRFNYFIYDRECRVASVPE